MYMSTFYYITFYSLSFIMYTIHKITKQDSDIIIQFKLSTTGNIVKSNIKHYKKYSRPTDKHMVEPDGNVFVCDDIQSSNFRTNTHNPGASRCHMHNKPMGFKFHLGTTNAFVNRTKQELDHCRCYCVPATQCDYDKWCYNDCKKNAKPLCDNAKIYDMMLNKHK